MFSREDLEIRIAQREQWVSECMTHWLALQQLRHRESAWRLAQRIANRARRLDGELKVLYGELRQLPWP